MKKRFSSIVSAALAFAMCLTLMSTAAFAYEVDEVPGIHRLKASDTCTGTTTVSGIEDTVYQYPAGTVIERRYSDDWQWTYMDIFEMPKTDYYDAYACGAGEFTLPASGVYKIMHYDMWNGGLIVIYVTAGGGSAPVEPEEPKPPVEKPSSWAEGFVTEAVAAGIVPANLQSKYTQAITRAEFCALATAVYETITGAEVTERVTFTDTTDVNVEKMAALNVVTGVSEGKFAPDAKLTREQAAVMLSALARALGKPLADHEADFTDRDSISGWAVNAVGQVQAQGVMGGVGDNNFAPRSSYTREQSILTMLRIYQYAK